MPMKDLDDYQLDLAADAVHDGQPPPEEAPPEGRPPEEPREPSSSPPLKAVIVVVAALVVIAIVFYWFFGRTPPPPEIAPAPETAPTAPRPPGRVEGEAIVQEDLPELDGSDELVRQLVSTLSENPQLASWLVNEDLVRRFVVSVDNMAEGLAPRPHLGFLEPRGDFEVDVDEGRRTIAATSFRRYDLVTEVFTSLDTEGTLELYERLRPLLQQAYSDLGYPNRDFADTLSRALRVIAETPRPAGEIEVVPQVKSYHFADPRLEELSSVEKQLLRFGPRNVARIQAKAAELASALDARSSG